MVKNRPVPRRRLFVRFCAIACVSAVSALLTIVSAVAGLVAGGRRRAKTNAYKGFVAGLQRLGPTFVKFGQISSTRRDRMSPELCDAMSVLHDAVRPLSARRTERVLRDLAIDGLADVDPAPIASGSIAVVHRGRLDDGRLVALKIKRPGIDARMRADLALLEAAVRLFQRLPSMRGMPMADLVGYISTAILGQLDFTREARNIERLREVLAAVPGVVVPAVLPDKSTATCLVFEYVAGLDAATPDGLSPAVRERLAGAVLEAAHLMMFGAGFVHCDLHPGNVYLTSDERVVILDAGYCVQLPDRVRDLIGEFFDRLARGDGRRCGEIVLESAVDPTRADRAAFISDMAALVAAATGPGNRFDLSDFGDAVFKLQQKHGIYAASNFAFPLMSLRVLEGTVGGFSPAATMLSAPAR